MRYLPHTPEEINKICAEIGVKSPEELFKVIPDSLRLQGGLDLPKPMSETELLRHLKELGRRNGTIDHFASFLGGGAYHHYIPVAVSAITSRGEFMTAYTPYQPEISQGTLQAIFEYQTMMASLTGMDVANAGNYDGASALAEAVLMALRLTKKKRVLLASSIHPDYRQVVRTYLSNLDCEITEIPFDSSGRVDLEDLKEQCNGETAVFCVQSPNAFGVIEAMDRIAPIVKATSAQLVGCFSEAISLGFLKPFGADGADIVVGEGHSFGNFLNLGGPYLGVFATRQAHIRQMPGRVVGETVDVEGRKGYVLVLSTREQHIRREKATSNICTNQALCALATTVYLSLLGPQGLRYLGQLNYSMARHLRERLSAIKGVSRKFSAPHFNEFVLQLPKPPQEVLPALQQRGILGGIDISTWGENLQNSILVCATEMNTKEQVDQFAQALAEVLS